MNKPLKLILPLPVSINALYVNQFSWNPQFRKRMPTGAKVLSAEGERVKKAIIKAAKEQLKNQEWDYEFTKYNFINMDAVIYFNRKGRDDNNIYKLNNDALEKIVYDNDSRILTRTQRIYYDKDNPRVELTFTPVDYVGIFDTRDEFESFFQRCLTCTRLDKNCSIFVDSVEAVIREEIVDGVCTKYKPKKGG